jgi:tetratricopeptide (TPR) repeat protein
MWLCCCLKQEEEKVEISKENEPLLKSPEEGMKLNFDHILPSAEERRKSLTPSMFTKDSNLFEEFKNLGENLEQDLEFYKLKLKIFENENNPLNVADTLTSIGNSFYTAEKYNEAIDYYDQALFIYQQFPEESLNQARTLTNIGNSYYNLNQFQESIEFYESSFVLFDESEDIELICRAVSNLGNSYFSLGKYEDAITYYSEVKKFCRGIGDLEGEKTAYTNLGNCYYALKDYKTAMELYKRRLDITDSKNQNLRRKFVEIK